MSDKMKDINFIERIQSLEKLTPSERKIADFFARNYNELAFENLTTISEKAEVSKPTALRFINKLGFERFADFRNALRKELSRNHDTLHLRYPLKRKLLQESEDDLVGINFTHTIANLESTHAHIDREQFMAIAGQIATCRNRLYICGQRSSHGLAYMFHNMVSRVVPNSVLVNSNCASEPDLFLDITTSDLLFCVFRHPYGAQSLQVMRYFHSRGAKTLLLTDSEQNPAAEIAKHQLVVDAEGVSIYTSSISSLALLESLNIAVLALYEPDVTERLKNAEELYKLFGTYKI